MIKTKEFSSERFSILLGFALGFGLLTKWSFLFFMFLPVSIAVVLATKTALEKKEYFRLRNILFAGLLTNFIAGFWYFSSLRNLRIDMISSLSAGVREGDPSVGSFDSSVYYLENLLNNQLYIVLLLFFLVGLFVIMLKRNKYFSKNLYPLSLIFGAIFIFTFLSNKDARYTLPIVSSIALVSVFWIDDIEKTKRKLLSMFLVFYSLVTFFSVSFGTSLLPRSIDFDFFKTKVVLFAQHGYLIGSPTKDDWKMEQIIFKVKNNSVQNKTFSFEGIDSIWFNKSALSYFAHKEGLEFSQDEEKAGFLLLRSSEEKICPKDFEKVQSDQLPDKTSLVLCKRLLTN